VTDSWLHLTVRTGAASLDAVANFLIERGSSGVVLKRNVVEAYFPNRRAARPFKKTIHRFVDEVNRIQGGRSRPRLVWRVARPENWQQSWKRFIRPSRVGKRFWITPPWITPPKFRNRQVITIEPGMAFGTGTHATTRGCLEFLEQAAAKMSAQRFCALDIGTGSGVLAIALAKLGAMKVIAIDNDPVALAVARENIALNGAAPQVRVSAVSLKRLKTKFPIVVANLTAETIIDLARAIDARVAPGGDLILSGILHSKGRSVIQQLSPGFRILRRKRAREWLTLWLRRG
jgi:ribosomal protein L11 methyltransferase